MKVKILKCERGSVNTFHDGHLQSYYVYIVRVYDGFAQGTHRIEVSQADILAGQLENIIHKKLDGIAATNLKKEIEGDKVQAIVGKIFHW